MNVRISLLMYPYILTFSVKTFHALMDFIRSDGDLRKKVNMQSATLR